MSIRTAAVPAVVALSLVPVLAGCAGGGVRTDDPSGHGSWGYSDLGGPAEWGGLDDAFATCGSGEHQSPVDLPAPADGDDLPLTVADRLPGRIEDNGHTVQFTSAGGARSTIDGEVLEFAQVHFHVGSEHTVRGEQRAAEFHFVHADDDGALTVLGVLVEPGRHNAAFDAFTAAATADQGRDVVLDVAAMLPGDRAFATYSGSLTTPPCTEGVRWIVFEQAVQLGADQLEALAAAHDHNARPVQELGDRTVRNSLD